MTQRKAKGYYYIVVTGPYANRAAAQEQMKKNPSWAKAWLRGPKSMQQQFED
jgi:septal ring-binding cell division protein DamX